MASVVGAVRALEEGGLRPAVISLCSGSAIFGFPLAAGLSTEEVAAFTLSLQPEDYIDVDWGGLLSLVPTVGRGFAGMLRGEAIEDAYRRLLGDIRLGEMPIPAYAPIWNIEQNRLEFIGPRTYPDVPVARAVHMAIALPLFIQPVELAGFHWCDGGIVDIFPVRPVLDIEPAIDTAVAVNAFYPHEFGGEDVTGWDARPLSIVSAASQVRTSQHAQLAREHLARLRREARTLLIEPVPYWKVAGAGFYQQFLDSREWPQFMRAGREATLASLRQHGPDEPPGHC